MAGIIIGAYGFQRSGKSLIAFLTAEKYHMKGCPVYTNIYYRLLDNVRRQALDFTIEKTPKLFSQVRYDSRLVPDMVDCNLKRFADKVHEYNQSIQKKQLKSKKQKTGGQYL